MVPRRASRSVSLGSHAFAAAVAAFFAAILQPCSALCWPGSAVSLPYVSAVTSCTPCSAGRYDHDSDPTSACLPCPSSTYTAGNGTACPLCESGRVDHDKQSSTACLICPHGTYTEPGYATASGATPVRCPKCEKGYADLDRDPATVCDSCQVSFARRATRASGGEKQCRFQELLVLFRNPATAAIRRCARFLLMTCLVALPLVHIFLSERLGLSNFSAAVVVITAGTVDPGSNHTRERGGNQLSALQAGRIRRRQRPND